MRAIRPETTGGPEAMTLTEHPTPEPGPGEVRVRVEAAGANFIDIYRRSGQNKGAPPGAMGLEGAGVIEAVGAGALDFKPGSRVAWASAPGSYATHVVIPAAKLVPVPAGVDAKPAAAAMLQGMTAHYLCHATAPLRAGDECLVHAA